MSDDTPTVTEREAKRREVLAKRAGWVDARMLFTYEWEDPSIALGHFEKRAAERYPLPKKTEPNEWTDWLGDRYRAVDGTLEVQHATATTWRAVDDPIAKRVRALANLLAYPIREVEDTGDDT